MLDNNRNGYIYTLSCPNSGLVRYVGQTVDIEKRYNLHIFHSKNGRARTHKEKWINCLLANKQKPELSTIWEGSTADLDQKEIEFIALYKSFGAHLTNATSGGMTTRGRKCSEETKDKFRSMFTGVFLRPPISEAEKIAISKRNKGKKHSEEFKNKLSAAKKGKPGFWSLNDMPEEVRRQAAENGKKTSRKVISVKDGVETVYPSVIEAARVTGCDKKSLWAVANGINKQTKGFVFKYA